MQEHQEVQAIGSTLLCSGTQKMVIPAGGQGVRQVVIRLPRFSGEPAFTATVCSPQSLGGTFAIWDINIQDLGNETQVVVSASIVAPQSSPGEGVPYDYFCSYVAVGKGL